MELKYYAGKDVLDALLDCMERISKQDGADVVEVVRCKDCKWYHYGHCMRPINTIKSSFIFNGPMEYCSYGQREEDEG